MLDLLVRASRTGASALYMVETSQNSINIYIKIYIRTVHIGHKSVARQQTITQHTSQFGWERLLTCGSGFAKNSLCELCY